MSNILRQAWAARIARVNAAMFVRWYLDDDDPRFEAWADANEKNSGNYCLDHGFVKKVEMERAGFKTEVGLHANYGFGCDVCNGLIDNDDPRIDEEHLDRRWSKVAAASIKQGKSPLDYHGTKPQRLAIHDSDLDGESNGYFQPPHSALPADDDTVAFLDYSEYADYVYIHFMATRPSHARQGLARKLVEHLYAMTDKDIDWGRIISDEAEALWRDIAKKHPTRWNKAKTW